MRITLDVTPREIGKFEIACLKAAAWIIAHPGETWEVAAATPEYAERFQERVAEILQQTFSKNEMQFPEIPPIPEEVFEELRKINRIQNALTGAVQDLLRARR